MCRPVAWTSADGSSWDLMSTESPFGSTAYVNDMAELDGRLVAVGGHGTIDEGAMWVSDGLTWTESSAEFLPGFIGEPPWAIAAGAAGWVALYGNPARAAYSQDGLTWVVATEELPDIRWGYGAPGLAVGSDQILVTYHDVVALGEITR